jgi:kynurenine formamidase
MNTKGLRFIDLSLALESDFPSDPPGLIPQIDYIDHVTGGQQMTKFFPGSKAEDLPGGFGWAVEHVSLTTHSGTHLDAPYHYYPTMDRGKPSMTVDEIPLEWCFGDGVLLDFAWKADGDRISAEDVQKELDRIGYSIKPMDIVLVRTGADSVWGTPQYLGKGAGMTRESTLFLAEKGVKMMGIDAWGWDRPLPFQAEEFKETHDPKAIWEAHFAGRDCIYCHMEKLANLAGIGRPHGFVICCFPVKIKRASAGWVRVVAIVDGGKP